MGCTLSPGEKSVQGLGSMGVMEFWLHRAPVSDISDCLRKTHLRIWFTLTLLPHYFASDIRCVGVYNPIQCWHFLELARTPQVKGSVPQNSSPPHHRPAINQRFPWAPPQVQSFARIAHRTQGNSYLHLPVYYIIKDAIKYTNEQPDEEIHRMRSRRVSRTGTSVSVELGYATLLAHEWVHQLGSFLNLAHRDF